MTATSIRPRQFGAILAGGGREQIGGRGLFRTGYNRDTLRGNLSLPVPESRRSRPALTWRAAARG
jgi:hypothetical protein